MKKHYVLLSALMICSGNVLAQEAVEVAPTALLPTNVKAVIDRSVSNNAEHLICVAGSQESGYKAFFAATDDTNGEELWVTDGTAEGTKLVKDINAGTGSAAISYLTRFSDKVVFTANDGSGVKV